MLELSEDFGNEYDVLFNQKNHFTSLKLNAPLLDNYNIVESIIICLFFNIFNYVLVGKICNYIIDEAVKLYDNKCDTHQ